jgi:hypothetical protein
MIKRILFYPFFLTIVLVVKFLDWFFGVTEVTLDKAYFPDENQNSVRWWLEND